MEVFIGTIMPVGFNFAPRGWLTCQGQLLSIAQNTAMFSLLGTTFGGNGQQTFGIPNAQGRTFLGQGQGAGLPPVNIGDIAGTPSTTLTIANMPAHNHSATFTPSGGAPVTATLQAMTGKGTLQTATPATGDLLGIAGDNSGNAEPTLYVPASAGGTPVNLGGLTVSGGGGGGTVTVGLNGNNLPVPTQGPYLGINYIIATQGIFPTRN